MTTVTNPRVGVPIGTVTIDGMTFDVATHPEFVRFFESLTTRVGGVTGASSNDLSLSQFEDAGIEETKAVANTIADAAGQVPTYVLPPQDDDQAPDLRAEIDALRQRIDALEQGVSL